MAFLSLLTVSTQQSMFEIFSCSAAMSVSAGKVPYTTSTSLVPELPSGMSTDSQGSSERICPSILAVSGAMASRARWMRITSSAVAATDSRWTMASSIP